MKILNTEYLNSAIWFNKSITFLDYGRIMVLIQDNLGNQKVSPDILHNLYLLASVSKIYLSDEVPSNVVTMNSEVILQFDENREQRIRIVYPEDIKTDGDVSLYSPVGAACLGAAEGSSVYFHDGSGYRRATIKELVFQPEKEKLYYL
ncbi:MAG: GreA/GreB family elongation factor [Bacteroidales bacterium]|nr:GreA/GreB family elongation factor [Bacteroidales bacterium]